MFNWSEIFDERLYVCSWNILNLNNQRLVDNCESSIHSSFIALTSFCP